MFSLVISVAYLILTPLSLRSTVPLFIGSTPIDTDGPVEFVQIFHVLFALEKACKSVSVVLSSPYNTSVLSAAAAVIVTPPSSPSLALSSISSFPVSFTVIIVLSLESILFVLLSLGCKNRLALLFFSSLIPLFLIMVGIYHQLTYHYYSIHL